MGALSPICAPSRAALTPTLLRIRLPVWLLAALPGLAGSACSLQPAHTGQWLTIHWGGPAAARTAGAPVRAPGPPALLHGAKAPRGSRPPRHALTIDSFNCIAINVTGAGIPATIGVNHCISPGTGSFGVSAGWVSADGATLKLLVPSGRARLVQVLGLSTPGACPDLGQMLGGAVPAGSVGPVELGRQVADTLQGASVAITVAYDPASSPNVFCDAPPAAVWDASAWDSNAWGP